MPKRIIGASHFSVTGRVSSGKNRSGQQSESLLEQDFLTLLEFDKRVYRYGVQPITIQWKNIDGKQQKYTPDVIVLYHTTAPYSIPLFLPTIYEVKSVADLKRDWLILKPKYKAATSWARLNGYRFKLITDKQIRTPYLENVRFLLRYREKAVIRNEEIDQQKHIVLRESLRTLGTSTPRLLLRHITAVPNLQLELIPMIWQMMHIGVISADLNQPLTMKTPIWLRERGNG